MAWRIEVLAPREKCYTFVDHRLCGVVNHSTSAPSSNPSRELISEAAAPGGATLGWSHAGRPQRGLPTALGCRRRVAGRRDRSPEADHPTGRGGIAAYARCTVPGIHLYALLH